tara:strand:- start:212 stop:499 length:288 start_codon:yes stop_codon:yes gene_type:complete
VTQPRINLQQDIGHARNGDIMAKTSKHYKKDGTLYTGGMHKMSDGTLHTGKTHTASSQKLFHMKDLSAKAKEKAKKQMNAYVGGMAKKKKKKKKT